MRVIAFAYDADLHCPACAAAAGMDVDGAVDSEGNEVGAVFVTDECPEQGEYCGDCGDEIREPWGSEQEPDDSMDGDHDSCMQSIGWGTDEDYGYYGDEGYDMYGPDE